MIASLPAGGGLLSLSPMPGRGGAYRSDLTQILGLGPELVISMTPRAEMAGQGAALLPDDLAAEGIAWLHVPVPDFGVPDPHQTAVIWPKVSARARAGLAGGGRVLVHCMGGCGRSGMAVLRLMAEAGETPAAALARLRQARPCAVETEAQLIWATAGKG